jgi:serine/threonine protein kinase
MKNTDWQKVQETFETVIELDESRQGEYLKSIETSNQELYNEVISLLSADQLGDVIPESRSSLEYFTDAGSADADTGQKVPGEAAADEVLIGETIGNRYQIIRKLGSGGMGDVFLAEDQNLLNRETVVKMLKSETNPEFARKFKHEIEALARLKDPGIVTILDSGTHGNQQFLVIEYVEGEDLSVIISPVLFSRSDFLSPRTLASKLTQAETELNGHFYRKLSPEARRKLPGLQDDKEIAIILRSEFDRLLTDPYLFNREIFSGAGIIIPAEITGIFERTDELMKFNRSMIEAAFPEDIVRGQDKSLTAGQAAKLFRQLGTSLTHGHNKGIIHRDLKPANIMITRNEQGEWQTKLIDFGVAKVQESLAAPTTEVGLSFGTRRYMSPEQINGNHNLTAATDIYALGLVAFEALTGQDVFPTDSFIERCRMQNDEEFSEITRFRKDLSPQVMDVIRGALAFEVENRPQTAEEFGKLLAEALLAGEGAREQSEIELPKTEIFAQAAENFTQAAENNGDDDTDVVEYEQKPEVEKYEKKPKEIINIPAESPVPGSGKGFSVAAGIISVLILVVIGVGGIIWWNMDDTETAGDNNTNQVAADDTVKRELNYKLIVRKYFEGKPFQDEFEATGDEIFGDGWRFKMVMNSPQSGHLYLLAESDQVENLVMLFPHPEQNDGTSEIAAKKEVETNQMEFDKNQGTEKFWIVWSKEPVSELEAVKSYVNPEDLGQIKDAAKDKAVREFLKKTSDEGKLTEKNSDDKRSKSVTSTSDVLVKLAEFRHN